jgi:hypothetical protein
MIYFDLIDQMMQFFSSGKYYDEAVSAKEEFSRGAGVMDEGESGYEMKFNQFVDWYLFTRPLDDEGLTPAVYQAQRNPMKVPSDLQLPFLNLSNSRHSLFLYLGISKSDLSVKDLFSGYKFVIKNSPVVHGFEKDLPFEGRLIPHQESFIFSNSFCFHPAESKKFILAEIKKVSKLPETQRDDAREALILQLFRMKHRFERYSHVPVKEIYTSESRVKL